MKTVTIVTPWLNHPELIPQYEAAVQGAEQVIIIDNGSNDETAAALADMMKRLPGALVTLPTNQGYSHANNLGLERATGEIVIFLNNDIEAAGDWLSMVRQTVHGKCLVGPSLGIRYVDGIPIPYLEGWCLAGETEAVRRVGGWNDTDFPGLYWEDNEFCYRATRGGLSLRQARLPLRHINNYTSSRTPGAYDNSEANRAVFESIVRRNIAP